MRRFAVCCAAVTAMLCLLLSGCAGRTVARTVNGLMRGIARSAAWGGLGTDWLELDRVVDQAVEEAMAAVDWEEIDREVRQAVEEAMAEVDWDEINEEIRQAMTEVDWDSIQDEVDRAMSGLDRDFLQNEIDRAMDAVDWDAAVETAADKDQRVEIRAAGDEALLATLTTPEEMVAYVRGMDIPHWRYSGSIPREAEAVYRYTTFERRRDRDEMVETSRSTLYRDGERCYLRMEVPGALTLYATLPEGGAAYLLSLAEG